MPIYTRTGDQGETHLYGGKRVAKDDPRVEAYGSVDELNALLGVAMTTYTGSRMENLKEVQRALFFIGAHLASPKPMAVKGIDAEAIDTMEKAMDEIESAVGPLRHFILPGGGKSAALLHLARTVCRRAERRVIALHRKEKVDPQIIVYLNRLSDWLFMLAREENARAKINEQEWKG
jgi:cob(I)alamin adenosyltransferase